MLKGDVFAVILCYLSLIYMIVVAQNNKVTSDDKEEIIRKNLSSTNKLSSAKQDASSQTHIQHSCQHSLGDNLSSCSTNEECFKLNANCLNCDFNCTCIYGSSLNITCQPKPGVSCTGTRIFTREMVCQYCYQTSKSQHICSGSADCPAVSSPRKRFKANCTVADDILCLGNRTFSKMQDCNWTSGYDWLTVLIMSITLGGFGADRFYLGHWREGIGKLLSFGGLGVWTIIDVFLIFARYLGPANHSLYMENVCDQ